MKTLDSNVPTHYENVLKTLLDSRDASIAHYMKYSLFSIQFWCILVTCVIVVVIWIKLVDKSRLLEMCLFVMIWQVSAETLDQIGTTFLLWEYPIKLFPLYTILVTNFIIIPFGFTLAHQYTNNWKKYVIASIAFAAIASFIAEPIYIWSEMYVLIHWIIIYSFPLYIVLAVIHRLIIEKIITIQSKKTSS